MKVAPKKCDKIAKNSPILVLFIEIDQNSVEDLTLKSVLQARIIIIWKFTFCEIPRNNQRHLPTDSFLHSETHIYTKYCLIVK